MPTTNSLLPGVPDFLIDNIPKVEYDLLNTMLG